MGEGTCLVEVFVTQLKSVESSRFFRGSAAGEYARKAHHTQAPQGTELDAFPHRILLYTARGEGLFVLVAVSPRALTKLVLRHLLQAFFLD